MIHAAPALFAVVIAVPGLAAAQEIWATPGNAFDQSLSPEIVISTTVTMFDTHCATALRDPNALIALTQERHQSGKEASLGKTPDNGIIDLQFSEGNSTLHASFLSQPGRSQWTCGVMGIWMPGLPGSEMATAWHPDRVVARVLGELGNRPGLSVMGGEMTAIFGDVGQGPSVSEPLAQSGLQLLLERRMHSVLGLWPEIDAVAMINASGGTLFLSALRDIGGGS